MNGFLYLSILKKTLLNRMHPGKWYYTVRLVCWSSLTVRIKPNIQSNVSEKVIKEKNGYNFLPDLKRFYS